jgi:hypothetical protein
MVAADRVAVQSLFGFDGLRSKGSSLLGRYDRPPLAETPPLLLLNSATMGVRPSEVLTKPAVAAIAASVEAAAADWPPYTWHWVESQMSHAPAPATRTAFSSA